MTDLSHAAFNGTDNSNLHPGIIYSHLNLNFKIVRKYEHQLSSYSQQHSKAKHQVGLQSSINKKTNM